MVLLNGMWVVETVTADMFEFAVWEGTSWGRFVVIEHPYSAAPW